MNWQEYYRARRIAAGEAAARFFADTVITEHGSARLLGRDHRERAVGPIAVAHPDHHAELRESAVRLFGWDSRPYCDPVRHLVAIAQDLNTYD